MFGYRSSETWSFHPFKAKKAETGTASQSISNLNFNVGFTVGSSPESRLSSEFVDPTGCKVGFFTGWIGFFVIQNGKCKEYVKC